jgi:hypothetical protein
MEFVYFTLAGLLLYFLSDWLLGRIEAWRGAACEQRNLIFFAIILVLALTSFKAIELLTGA